MVLKLKNGHVRTALVVDKNHLEKILQVDKENVFDRQALYPTLEQAVAGLETAFPGNKEALLKAV